MKTYAVIISARASIEYEQKIQYITSNFGKAKSKNVEEQYALVVNQIAKNPFQFPVFNIKRKIRKCVLSPQITLYYSVKDTFIELVSFRNNFKNQETLKL